MDSEGTVGSMGFKSGPFEDRRRLEDTPLLSGLHVCWVLVVPDLRIIEATVLPTQSFRTGFMSSLWSTLRHSFIAEVYREFSPAGFLVRGYSAKWTRPFLCLHERFRSSEALGAHCTSVQHKARCSELSEVCCFSSATCPRCGPHLLQLCCFYHDYSMYSPYFSILTTT